jgi:hypothetical protein
MVHPYTATTGNIVNVFEASVCYQAVPCRAVPSALSTAVDNSVGK